MATTLIDMGLGGSGTDGGNNGAGTPVVSTQVTDPQVQAIVQLRQENEKNKQLVTWLAVGLGLLLVANFSKGDEGESEDES
jgi:hypothetical protein